MDSPSAAAWHNAPQAILVVEDNEADAYLVQEHLEEAGGYAATYCEYLRDALTLLSDGEPRIIITDLGLPDALGLDCVQQLRAASPESPLIVLSGMADESVAIEAMKLGAQDYLMKGQVDADSLARAIRYATERKRTELKLVRLAHHDHLTGLSNRATFRSRLSKAMARVRRTGGFIAVLFLDLDRFKQINDTLGHDAGDQLLKGISGRLLDTVRDMDTVARLGGDEFAIVLEELESPERANEVAERVLHAVAQPLVLDGESIVPACSVGVACFPMTADSPDELLKQADESMYSAKRAGRNRVSRFTGGSVVRTLPWDQEFVEALGEGRFVLHYQTQFDPGTGAQLGAEALLRLRSGGGSIIPPVAFIPALETSDQLFAVTGWVIDEACRQVAEHRAAGHSLSVAVNVLARDLARPGLVATVGGALRKFSLPGDALELEITERMLLSDSSVTRTTLAELRSMGVRVAIDDFGTGYGSLGCLERFPVDVLKIARSFVSTIGRTGNGGTVAAAVIGLSHTLGLTVVGDGVETPKQLEFLRAAGCDGVQGLLLSRPTRLWCPTDRLQTAGRVAA
ncbi:MAG: GGDEF domain-containing response regulator [Nannocystaceae bacterium]